MPKVSYLQASVLAERTLSSQQVAELLHISEKTLERYRGKGTGPKYVEINHKIKFYLESEVYKWMAERTRTSTSDTGN